MTKQPFRQEPDGRMVTVQTPAPAGWYTFGCGRSDKPDAVPPESPNGTGDPIFLSLPGLGDADLKLTFVQPIFLHNGQLYFRGAWGDGDEWSFWVEIPASDFDEGGAKDLIFKDFGNGAGAWIPADPGHGTHSFDQAKAIPVPVHSSLVDAAYWNLDENTDSVLPVYGSPAGKWALVNFATRSYFFRSIPIPSEGEFKAPTYQSEWISTKWLPHFSVHKASAGAGSASGWLMTFRQDTR